MSRGVDLRPLEIWHAEEFAQHLDRARDHIRLWVGPAFVTDSVDGARATLRRYANASAADGARLYGLWIDDTLVGGVMFVTFDAEWGVCEVGCWLEEGFDGRAVIARAVAVLVDWALCTRKIARVEWHCRTDSAHSSAIAERLGMRLEGMLRSSWIFEGRRFEKQTFSMTRTKWTGE